MTSLTLCSIFCVIILFANISGNNCHNNPEATSLMQQIKLDRGVDPDNLDQIYLVLTNVMGKLENVNEQLVEISKRQSETEAKLTEIIKWKNETEEKFTAIIQKINVTKDCGAIEDTLRPESTTVPAAGDSTTSSLPYTLSTSELTSTASPGDVVKNENDSLDQTESPFVLDATTLPEGRGGIVFDGSDKSPQRSRFWVIENADTVKFTLERNELIADSRLTITGFHWLGLRDKEFYINSSTANGTEFTVRSDSVVILVTMTCRHDTRLTSSFALGFLHTRNDRSFLRERTLYPSTFVTGEGRTKASFPQNNTLDYLNNANHLMLIFRPSGRDFNLTQTFVDIPWGKGDHYTIYGKEDEAERTRLISDGMKYGKNERKNLPLGRYSAAVVLFYSDNIGTGKGYELAIE